METKAAEKRSPAVLSGLAHVLAGVPEKNDFFSTRLDLQPDFRFVDAQPVRLHVAKYMPGKDRRMMIGASCYQ
jgi:hypothetical protein